MFFIGSIGREVNSMARYFEKISFEQFRKDISDDLELYESYSVPKRSTKESAGYDFEAIFDFTLKPGEALRIPLGIKIHMNSGEMMLLLVRSSQGYKYNVRMCNQIGLFEPDYCDNPTNEGHAWIRLQNHGEKDYVVHKGDKICQAVFTKFLTVDDEDVTENERVGGLGSTDYR